MCGYFCKWFIDFMLTGEKSTDYTSLFSPHDFKKKDNIILSYFKDEWMQFYETIDKTNLTNQAKFSLGEISKTENCFIEEINQRKSCSKKLSKLSLPLITEIRF